MSETTSTSKTLPVTQVKISDVVFNTLRHWPWILLSLVLCVGGAYFYLLRTTPVYSRTATILIKDDSKGASTSQLDAFADMGLIQTHTNLTD